MNIQQSEANSGGRFFIETDDHEVARLEYSLSDALMTIQHTAVDEKFQGKNIGYQLVSRAAEYARGKSLKIKALCPFAAKVFQKKKDDYSDVLL